MVLVREEGVQAILGRIEVDAKVVGQGMMQAVRGGWWTLLLLSWSRGGDFDLIWFILACRRCL